MKREKTTKDLGTLSGRILVFGGVYSNWQALQRMWEIAARLHISAQNIICTGDIIAYCAQPAETLQSFTDRGVHTIAGNVEIQLREGQDECGCDFTAGSRCDVFSRNWYPYAQEQLSAESKARMHDYPDFLTFSYAGKKCCVVHGSYFETSEFIFKSTPWSVKARNFSVTDADVILAGHCGLPFHHLEQDKMWLNPGVIGMPANDGTTRVWYMVLEENVAGGFAFQHHAFDYDHRLTAKLMRDNQLPPEYAHTLETGLWDNCDILPEEETALQGKRIELADKIF